MAKGPDILALNYRSPAKWRHDRVIHGRQLGKRMDYTELFLKKGGIIPSNTR